MGQKKNAPFESTLPKSELDVLSEAKSADSKTIAQIDFKIVEENETYNYLEKFVEDHNHCPLCGDELLFTHVTEFVKQTVNEEAHCESCKIRIKQTDFQLQ